MSLPSEEQWRPVSGYEGHYEVSNLGRMKTLARAGKIISPQANPKGYLRVYLCHNGHRRWGTVHTLVAAAFIGPRPDGLVIRHRDGNHLNNAASNLAYGTQAENEQDKLRHGTHPEAIKTHCPGGHPYDEANTYVDPQGHRFCRECRRERSRAVSADSKLVAARNAAARARYQARRAQVAS